MATRRNRLANETSPYLLQHADNPVDWYPWGDEALAKAKAEQKPIFLSIGYSACHWCHVMESESFVNESIAALLNEHFISIKVDREERPDLDDFYMTFVQMTTGGGGWPMSVFLTPDGEPFFGGTYFPPDDAYGRRGFSHILKAVAQTWKQQREEVLTASSTLLSDLQSHLTRNDQSGPLEPLILDRAVQEMLDRFDPIEGGFGGAPKFPPSYALSFLMKQYWRNGDPRVIQAVTLTLDKMAAGGMYDHLGGGFHRYSVDAHWLVPHFEKMLYDNAQLATTYLEAFQLTNKPLYRTIAIEILDYVLRDLRDPAGGFHSSEDADSEGHEGKFYVWTPEEIIDVLGPADGKLFCDYYGVTNAGNFEGHRSILHVRTDPELFAKSYRFPPSQLKEKLSRSRSQLLKTRSSRIRPFKDDKVLTEWNGLMLTALAKGYQVAGDARYLDAATDCARFVESTMLTPSGLLRVYRQGTAKQPGFLADHAFLINGLIDLYETAFDPHWLELGAKLTKEMIDRFSDTENGGFFTTATGQTSLPIRQKDSFDGAVPSGNSVATIVLLRLSMLLDRPDWRVLANRTIASLSKSVVDMPAGFMNLLNAFYLGHHSPLEFAIVGSTDDPSTRSMIDTIHATFHPNRVIALHDPGRADSRQTLELISILRNRKQVDNKATVYVCRDRACLPPATTLPELFLRLLDVRAKHQ